MKRKVRKTSEKPVEEEEVLISTEEIRQEKQVRSAFSPYWAFRVGRS